MTPIIAQAQSDSSHLLPYLVVGMVVVGLSSLVQLALATKQLFGGNKGERQIELTQVQAITDELALQTATLNKVDREMGEAKAAIKAVDDKISAQEKTLSEKIGVQAQLVDNAFKRINAISTESATVKGRLDDHLQDHRGGRL